MVDRYYILDENREPKAVPLLEWAQWFATAERKIRFDKIGDADVSTVFIGLDHRHERACAVAQGAAVDA